MPPTIEEIQRDVDRISGQVPGVLQSVRELVNKGTGVSEIPDVPAITQTPTLSSEEQFTQETGRDLNVATPTFGTSFKDITSQFQGQIDSLDQALALRKADIIREQQKLGEGRLGSQRAIQAATGMLGQISGFGLQQELETANIQAQQTAVREGTFDLEAQKRALFGTITNIAREDLQAKLKAQTQTADEFLEWRRTSKANKQEKLSRALRAEILRGTELDDNDFLKFASIENIGLSASEIKDSYTLLKSEFDAGVAEVEVAREEKEFQRIKDELGLRKTEAEIKKLQRDSKSSGFSTTQLLKLEQAGLLDGSRQDQLDLLFGGGVEDLFTTPDGQEVDLSTTAGLQTLADNGFSSEDIRSFVDEETKLTKSSIDALLGRVEFSPDDTTINAIIAGINSKIKSGKLDRGTIQKVIDTGTIKTGGVTYTLTAEQQTTVQEGIRSGIQAFFPGGR